MVYKGKNILDQNQDTLIKLKNNNGKLYFYKCVRKIVMIIYLIIKL